MDLLPPPLPKATLDKLLSQAVELTKNQPLKVAQVIQVKVEVNKADQTLTLKSGAQTFTAPNDLNLVDGEELLLKVSNLGKGEKPEFTIIQRQLPSVEKAVESLPNQLIRQLAQGQNDKTLAKLFTLMLSDKTLANIPAVKTLLTALSKTGYDQAKSPDSKGLQQAIKDSGVFLENKLVNQLADNRNPQNPAITNDTKSLLLKLKHEVQQQVAKIVAEAKTAAPTRNESQSTKASPQFFVATEPALKTLAKDVLPKQGFVPASNQGTDTIRSKHELPPPIRLARPQHNDAVRTQIKENPTKVVLRPAPKPAGSAASSTGTTAANTPFVWPSAKPTSFAAHTTLTNTPLTPAAGTSTASPAPAATASHTLINSYLPQALPSAASKPEIAIPFTDNVIELVLQQLDSAIQRIQTQQIHNVQQGGLDTLIHLLFDLPVRHNDKQDHFHIELENQNTKKPEHEQVWDVKIHFELDGMGPVTARIRLQGESVSTSFWVPNSEVSKLFDQHSADLNERLCKLGLNVNQISCFNQAEPMPNANNPYSQPTSIVDEKI